MSFQDVSWNEVFSLSNRGSIPKLELTIEDFKTIAYLDDSILSSNDSFDAKKPQTMDPRPDKLRWCDQLVTRTVAIFVR